MAASPPSKRLLHRWSCRLRPMGVLGRMVDALQTLLEASSGQDPLFILRSLDLLVQHLGAEVAYLTMTEDEGFEIRWWSPEREHEPSPTPVACFCAWLHQNPFRMMVLRNLRDDPAWSDHPELRERGLGAAAGVALRSGSLVRGLLFLHFKDPTPLERTALALLDAVGGFLAKAMEVEQLRFSLDRLENALAITQAVAEDNAIQDPKTRLPNRRYLDIWLKANLATSEEVMTVALWQMDEPQISDSHVMQHLGESIRGGDLLVSLGQGRFLLALQRTTKGMGHLFLTRLREKMGAWPMGASVWLPGEADFGAVLTRCEKALGQSLEQDGPGLLWCLNNAEGASL